MANRTHYSLSEEHARAAQRVQKRLQDVNLTHLEIASGVARSRLSAIRSGKIERPAPATIDAIEWGLERMDRGIEPPHPDQEPDT